MSSPSPRRRHSKAVYRRRRLLVLLGLVLLIVGIVWLVIAQPWASSASLTSVPAPSASASASPTSSATPAVTMDVAAQPEGDEAAAEPTATDSAAPGCTRSDVVVEPLTDQDTYASGQNPQLSIRLTNTSDADCTINVGTTTQVFTITSGDDTWWRSTDCQSEPSDMIVTLAAGQSVTSATPLEWDRTRSSVDTCDSDSRPVASGGGASYHLSVEIGGVPSGTTTQFLLY
ncbi:hypothetical protein GCM10009808_24030 [Microbacterium sediminicola]|uniref:DUF4232 domain-containing protein n=1 Tax=Microbacterium sediminicola TaxID=415210 RepID=A0ABP4UGJ9_9MICO